MLAGHTSAPDRAPSHDPTAAHDAVGKHTLIEAIPMPEAPAAREEQQAARGVATPAVTFPHREMIQRLFGRHDISSLRAHLDEHSTGALGSHAFATGDDVVFAAPPDLHTAAHEAAHAIQQRGGVAHATAEHERHADEVADAVVRGQSAEPLLDRFAGGTPRTAVQHMKRSRAQMMHDPLRGRIDGLVHQIGVGANRDLIRQLIAAGLGDPAVIANHPGALLLLNHAKVAGAAEAVTLRLHAKTDAQLLNLLGHARIASGAQARALLDHAKVASATEALGVLGHAKVASRLELVGLLGLVKVVSAAELRVLLDNLKIDSAANLGVLLNAAICPNTTALVPFFADAHVPSLAEVRRVVARNEVAVWDTYWASRRNVTDGAATDRDALALAGMTLAELYAHGEAQADWHRGLASEQERNPIRLILGFLRNTAGALAGCGAWNTGDFWTAAGAGQAFDPTALQQAEAYARGVNGRITCPVPRKATALLGLAAGRDVLLLEAGLGRDLCRAIFNGAAFDRLHGSAHLQHFLDYVAACAPTLHATEGKEITSFLALRAGFDPLTVRATLAGWVRNLHRFEAAALRALAAAVGDRSGRRPVTVLIHTPLDHAGAFHRDANLTAVITRRDHLTLMIEGHGDLAGVGGRLDVIQRDYCGRGRELGSVMLVGHGSPRAVNITGTTDNHGHEHDTGMDLRTGGDRTFLERLIDRMASGRDAHLVFDACHTDSTAVERTHGLGVGTERDDARLIRDYLRDNPSLSDYARDYAERQRHRITVHGANGATRDGVEFLDRHDELTLYDRNDREIAGTKLAYIEDGQDPKGVMRAVLEVWASRPRDAADAMDRRSGRDSTDFKEQLIRVVFRIVRTHYWHDATNIAHMVEAVGNLKKLRYDDQCTVLKLAAAGLSDRDFGILYAGMQGTRDWRDVPVLPIVFHQRANRPGDVMTVLGTLRRPVRELTRDDRIYIAAAFNFGGQLPLLGVGTATRAQLLLAIIGFKQHNDAHCRAYLNAYFQAVNGALPGAADFEVTRESLMRDLGPQVAAVAQPLAANARAGGAGNAVRLEPLTRRGRTNSATTAHVAPDEAAASTPVLINTDVDVIGQLPGWLAVEDGNGTRYVPAHTVTLRAIPAP